MASEAPPLRTRAQELSTEARTPRSECGSTVEVVRTMVVEKGKEDMVEYLFNDTFTVSRLDPDGKKFDKVTRIEAHSDQMYMQLDVATEVYPMRVNEKFNMALVSTLNLDGTLHWLLHTGWKKNAC